MTPEDSFWAKVYKTHTCWFWIGALNNKRYAPRAIKFNGKWLAAHVFSYIFHFGELPEGQYVLHSCDTPQCVRPDHLHAGTQSQNLLERRDSGTVVNGGTFRTHCRKCGSELVVVSKQQGWRGCRACRIRTTREWKLKHLRLQIPLEKFAR